MSVDEAHIEADERGFLLVLTGDFTDEATRYLQGDGATITLRLSTDAAIQLNAQSQASINPWVDEMNSERAAFMRAGPAELREVLHGEHDEPGERLREAGDILRKAVRERA